MLPTLRLPQSDEADGTAAPDALDLNLLVPARQGDLWAEKLAELIELFKARRRELPEPQSHLYRMPPGGIPFNEVNYVDLPAQGNQSVIVSFVVPGGMNGVIRRLGNNIVGAGFTEGSGDLVYQIRADQDPLRNHHNILGSLGNPSAPTETDPIRLFESQTIDFVVRNVAVVVGLQKVGARLSGFFYPREYDGEEAWGG